MKRFLAFLLTTALMLTMTIPAFALKGGDGNDLETLLFEFSSEAKANALMGTDRFYGLTVDKTIVKPGSTSSVMLTRASKTAIVNGGQSPFSSWSGVNTDWSAYDGIKLHLYVSAKDATTTFTGKTARIILGANAVYNDSSNGNNNKDYWRYDLDISTLNNGWNVVEIPFTSFGSVIDGSTVSNKTLDDYKSEYKINSLTIINGTEGTYASTSKPFPWTLNLDSIYLTKNPVTYSYAVSSDSAILWEFNTEDSLLETNVGYASTKNKLSADYINVNAYDISAKYISYTGNRLQLKYPDTSIDEKEDNVYKYDYINFIILNSAETNKNFYCGIHWNAPAVAILLPGWNIVSIPIEDLFNGTTYGINNVTSANSRGGSSYSSNKGKTFNISDTASGAATTEVTSGTIFNFDMIWVSKTPAAVGTPDSNGSIVSQIPLTCTDTLVTDNGNGTSKASCKISSWPGERFVILFASYNADGSLNELTYVKDYDGGENKEKLYETSSITVPQGGKTKIMVWNGFNEIAPMTVSR